MNGEAGLQISYFSLDPATGQLAPFACASGADCSAACVPDAVTVSVTSYQFTKGPGDFVRPAAGHDAALLHQHADAERRVRRSGELPAMREDTCA